MQKGQTSVRGGIQDLLAPMSDLRITQGSNGQFSHKGSTAIDSASQYNINLYAPCDCICVAVDTKFAFVMWQSLYPVRFADGSIDYACFYFGHDSNINAKVGMQVKQGELIAQEGTGGKATGRHIHIEVAKGKYTGKMWIANKFGVYCIPNAIEFEDAFFMDGTNIAVGQANWKYLKDVPIIEKPSTNLHIYDVNEVKNVNGIWQLRCDYLVPVEFAWSDNGIPLDDIVFTDAYGVPVEQAYNGTQIYFTFREGALKQLTEAKKGSGGYYWVQFESDNAEGTLWLSCNDLNDLLYRLN